MPQTPGKDECILALLSNGDKSALGLEIQKFYLKWADYDALYQYKIRAHMNAHLPVDKRMLYDAMMAAFESWDDAQDELGAPGWNVNQNSINMLSSDLENEVGQLIHMSEVLWRTCVQRSKSSASQENSSTRRNSRNLRETRKSSKEFEGVKPHEASRSRSKTDVETRSVDGKVTKTGEVGKAEETVSGSNPLEEDVPDASKPTSSNTSAGIALKRSEFKMKYDPGEAEDVMNNNFRDLKRSRSTSSVSTSSVDQRVSRRDRHDRKSDTALSKSGSEGASSRPSDDITRDVAALEVKDITWEKVDD